MAGSHNISLNAADAAKVVNEFVNASDGIKSTIAKIADDTQTVLQNGWRGQASGAFKSAQADWEGEAVQLRTALDQMNESISQGNKILSNIDEDNANDVSSGNAGSLTNLDIK